MKEEDLYYVGIQNAADLRKILLNTSKDTVFLLQKYETIKSLREDKMEKVTCLKALLAEISSLSVKIKKNIPRAEVGEQKIELPRQSPYDGEKNTSGNLIQKKDGQIKDIEQLNRKLLKIEEQLREF